MKEVALITLHGMGERKPLYYEELENGLRKRLGDDWDRVSFQTVHYAPILQDPQDVLWNEITSHSKNKVRIEWLRKFFLFGFGDAGSLEHSAHRKPKNTSALNGKYKKP